MDKEKNSKYKILKKISLEKFIPAAFLIFLLFIFIISIITFSNIGLYKNDLDWAVHTQKVIQANENLLNKVIEMSFVRKGYIITGQDEYIDRFNNHKNQYYEQINALYTLVKENAEQTTQIRKLDSLCQENNSLLRESMVLYKREKKINDIQLAITYQVENNLENIKQKKIQIEEVESNLLKMRSANVERHGKNIQLFILLTTISAFVVIGGSIFVAHKLIREKNETENLLQESYEKLESRIKARTAELQFTNEKLKEEIDNREKFEKSLKESEERFRNLADSSPSLIWMTSENSEVYYVNKTWLEFTGLPMDSTREDWKKAFYPDEIERNIKIYKDAFEKREGYETEHLLRRYDGEYRWIYDIALPRFSGKEFKGYIGAGIDITDRKRSERYLNTQYGISRLLESSTTLNEVISEILQNITENIEWDFATFWMADAENQFLKPLAHWSKSFLVTKKYENLFSKNHKIKKGEGISGYVMESKKYYYIENVQNDEKSIIKNELIEVGAKSFLCVPIISNDQVIAEMIFLSFNFVPFNKELINMITSISSQIASFMERIRVQQELHESHLKLEQKVQERTLELASALNKLLKEIDEKEKAQTRIKLFAHAIKDIQEGIFITDLNNKIIFVNKSFEEITGYSTEELIGNKLPAKFIEDSLILDSDEGDTFPLKDWKGNLLTKRKDETPFFMYLSVSTIRNEDDEVEAYIQVCRDITESKQTELLINKRNNLLNLLNEIIILTNRIDDVQYVISQSLIRVCGYTNWEIGHCWLLNKNEILESSGIWNLVNPEFELFRSESEKLTFQKKEGLPGKTIFESKSSWIKFDDIENEKQFKRIKLTRQYGFKTGIWVPILKQDKPVGVLEFFNKNVLEPDYEVLDCLTNIGIEIGSMLERTENNMKLVEKERSLKAAQHVAKLGSWEYDVKANKFEMSDELYEIFELEKDFDPKIKNLFQFFPKEDVEHAMNDLQMAIKYKKPYSHIVRFHSSLTGKIKFLKVETEVVLDDFNEVSKVIGTNLDITEIKENEEKLLLSEGQLKKAQRLARMGSWEYDIEKDKYSMSDELYNLLELEKSIDVNPDMLKEYYEHESYQKGIELISESIKEKKPYTHILKIKVPRTKKLCYHKIEAEPLLDETGKVIKIIGSTIDITELKENEEKLLKSEHQLKFAQQLAKLGSFETNLQTGEQIWSDELFRIFDIQPGEITPNFRSIRRYIHNQDVNKLNILSKKVIQDAISDKANIRVITHKGIFKHLHIEVYTEYDDKQKPLRIFGSVQDITHIRIVEEELRRTNVKLIKAQNELIHNEKLAALGRFSAGIAHEIRNPLTNISTLSQLLTKANLDEKLKKHLKYINVNVDIANRVIKNLLGFASPEELFLKKENLKDILEYVILSLESRCAENNITIKKDFADNIPDFYADKTKIENALLNFSYNAIDAMGKGGTLSYRLFYNKNSKDIIIHINDTGYGIPKENLDKIFEPFFTTKKEGIGLGLGLAYHTIKTHHGDISIKSEPGKGTDIKIVLPIINKSENGENTNN